MNLRRCLLALVVVSPTYAVAPLSPRDEQATFRVAAGWRVELVASEPDIVDPVAMAFAPDGRLYVAEMRGYPNGGIATGETTLGRIRLLEDRDGDGVFETSRIYADRLRFPTSVLPWRDGLIVADAPDILFIDAAGQRRVLYSGFVLDNIQQLVNGLQWGLDNWIHAQAGNKGGDIRCPDRPDLTPVSLRGRGLRFRPDVPGSLEPTSGGGQFGLACDAAGHWFTATNSQHLRQIVLPDHYIRRNPGLAVPAVTIDIPDHGAACQLFRISPFEAWRVERTTRRAGSPDAKRFPTTELVPGGFVTSACSPLIVGTESLICDPANNLVHRDRLEPNGPVFLARRVDQGCEFLASTDNWFRPVALEYGPDGAIYVLDFYREVIETPLSLPDDMKAKLHLKSHDRGRIWRIVRDENKVARTNFADPNAVVRALGSSNPWARRTAQHAIVDSQRATAIPALQETFATSPSPLARLHALAALSGLKAPVALERGLSDASPAVQSLTLRLSEEAVKSRPDLRARVLALTNVGDPQVRFQLALTLGEMGPEATPALAELLRKSGSDPWIMTAVFTSSRGRASALLATLAGDADVSADTLTKLASLVGAEGDAVGLRVALAALSTAKSPGAILDGLGQGMRNGARGLQSLWTDPPADLADVIQAARPVFVAAANASVNRPASLRLLGYGPPDIALRPLAAALDATNPPEVQLAAAKALAVQPGPRPAELLIEKWDGFGPALRREAIEALCARSDRVSALLDAVEAKRISPREIESSRRDQLQRSRDAKVRARAARLLAVPPGDRAAIVAAHKPALDKTGDRARGQALFRQHCVACHKFGDEGHDVGPDFRAVLGTKTREAFLGDLLDPNREVDARYVNYQLTTKSGRAVTGILAVETAASVTLRRANREEDTVLRSQIEELQATTKSLMPEEFEKLLSLQDIADLMAFLLPAKP
ncbi:MAG: PVC-type heme-binding CxxCH protein [Gemmataceae bacterium]